MKLQHTSERTQFEGPGLPGQRDAGCKGWGEAKALNECGKQHRTVHC